MRSTLRAIWLLVPDPFSMPLHQITGLNLWNKAGLTGEHRLMSTLIFNPAQALQFPVVLKDFGSRLGKFQFADQFLLFRNVVQQPGQMTARPACFDPTRSGLPHLQ